MLDVVFGDKNLSEVQSYFTSKHDSSGYDGMLMSETYDYIMMNRDYIMDCIRDRKYSCKKTQLSEMINYKGKRRVIAKMCSIDRFIARALEQVISQNIDFHFSEYSFAYIKDKGVQKAVNVIRDYVKKNKFVCYVDIKSYFDEIDHELLLKELNKYVDDEDICYLIKCYLKCEIEYDFISSIKGKGLIQGNPISPLLSNIFLNSLDQHLEKKNVSFVRFADNIYMFFQTKEEGYNYLNHVKQILEARYHLEINKSKSGVCPSLDIVYLGYKIEKHKHSYEIVKRKREKTKYYSSWYTSPLRYIHHQYHIIDDGILRKKDFHILFENEEQKVDIPIETLDHINIYSQVVFTSSFFEMMNDNKTIINIFNKNGVYVGRFIPRYMQKSIPPVLNQARIYQDDEQRLFIAKKMVNASIHNERANVKYYYKKSRKDELQGFIDLLTNDLKLVNECCTYDDLLLVEARAKQTYFQSFQWIITNDDFLFEKRTKRPPTDNINALMSFGNTVLYNLIANEIYKTSLDLRIGYLHASNSRKESLNLDIADIFKPIIIDRSIFTLVNKNMISSQHFEEKNGGIYLNEKGKSIFLHQIYTKLYDKIRYQNTDITYGTLIRKNIYALLQHINNHQKLKFYKYQ